MGQCVTMETTWHPLECKYGPYKIGHLEPLKINMYKKSDAPFWCTFTSYWLDPDHCEKSLMDPQNAHCHANILFSEGGSY